MIAYKLCRVLKNGEITSLFINKKKRLPIGEWFESKTERDLSLILKTLEVNFNDEIVNGDTAFKKLVISDMLGENYIIDWNKTPCQIKTYK